MTAALVLICALSAQAGELGGHEQPEMSPPVAASTAAEDRASTLQEMWSRHVIAPDQRTWSEVELDTLSKIRSAEPDALAYLKKKFGSVRAWTTTKRGGVLPRPLLTVEGYQKYLFHLTQEAIAYFEAKGADAKWALKMSDEQGRRLFGSDGRLTDAGIEVYNKARLNLEVYWQSPTGETFGTRRPR